MERSQSSSEFATRRGSDRPRSEERTERPPWVARLLELSPDIAVVYDPLRDRIVYANQPAEALAGFSPSALRAMLHVSARLIDPQAPPEQHRFLRALADCTSDEIRQAELDLRHRDGTPRRLRFRAVPIELGPEGASRVLLVASTPVQRDPDGPPSLDRRALAVLSHELRNPLHTLRHASDLLRDQGDGHDLHRISSIIDRQTRQLAKLVETLLDVSRMGQGTLTLHEQTVDLARLAREATEAHQPVADRRGLTLSFMSNGEPIFVRGDAARLGQVFDNLLHNALKFTDEGSVLVRVERRDEQAVVIVRDSGIGLTPELARTLFEPLGRARDTLPSRTGGLGLGLPLVKGIVELHGGSVHAASEGHHKGVAMTVQLPACEPVTEPSEEPVPSSRGTSVLVIEDDPDAAELLQHMLRRAGHRVFVAHDGAEGLAIARTHHPDVIVCDIGLSEMSGYEVARALRIDPDLCDIPAVALTGYAEPEDRRLARAMGFDEHLTKPVEIATLQRVISRLAG